MYPQIVQRAHGYSTEGTRHRTPSGDIEYVDQTPAEGNTLAGKSREKRTMWAGMHCDPYPAPAFKDSFGFYAEARDVLIDSIIVSCSRCHC